MFCLETTLKELNDKEKEPEAPEPEPEPTTEVLFLCSYEGCGKTFIDAGALRKHSHIHGERQYVCHWEGCGKVSCLKFLLPIQQGYFQIYFMRIPLRIPVSSGSCFLGNYGNAYFHLESVSLVFLTVRACVGR